MAFNPAQPRGSNGRWTSGAASTGKVANASKSRASNWGRGDSHINLKTGDFYVSRGGPHGGKHVKVARSNPRHPLYSRKESRAQLRDGLREPGQKGSYRRKVKR